MLNNAWPSMIWHLYDWYLRPAGGYFGTKKACEPLHVLYSYDDRSVAVVNSYYESYRGLKVSAKIYNLDSSEQFSKEATLEIPPDSSTRAFTLPELPAFSPTYFVSLRLQNASGEQVSTNFYWLSTKAETLEWDKSDWYHTPTKTFADFTALNRMPRAELKVSSQNGGQGEDRTTTVTVTNPGKTIAFAVRLKLQKSSDGEEILPVLWQDNYFSLLPGETRRITATYRAKDLGKAQPILATEAWNAQ
jgi:exo-1,4-beta-D-glucosaminidase